MYLNHRKRNFQKNKPKEEIFQLKKMKIVNEYQNKETNLGKISV